MKIQLILSATVAAILITIALAYNSPQYSYAQQTSPVAPPTLEAPQPPAPPDELPGTAGDALPYIREWVLFVAALVSTHIMNGFKKIPGLGGQEWLAKLVTELVAGVSASVVAFVLGLAVVALGFLDQSGLYQVILFAWPAAVGIYHTKKFSKAGAALAK